MSGQVQVKPVTARDASLPACEVWDGDLEDAVFREHAAHPSSQTIGAKRVLENVPAGDGVEGTCQRAVNRGFWRLRFDPKSAEPRKRWLVDLRDRNIPAQLFLMHRE